DCLDLPIPFEQFQPEICWKIRVISYNDETGELTAEIIDYNYDRNNVALSLDSSFYFAGIEKIRFRSIDTAGLLKSVVLKKALPKQVEVPKSKTTQKQPVEHLVHKTMKVPFS